MQVSFKIGQRPGPQNLLLCPNKCGTLTPVDPFSDPSPYSFTMTCAPTKADPGYKYPRHVT